MYFYLYKSSQMMYGVCKDAFIHIYYIYMLCHKRNICIDKYFLTILHISTFIFIFFLALYRLCYLYNLYDILLFEENYLLYF